MTTPDVFFIDNITIVGYVACIIRYQFISWAFGVGCTQALCFVFLGIQPCECQNGGVCVDPHFPRQCNCPAGFYGTLCESRKCDTLWNFLLLFSYNLETRWNHIQIMSVEYVSMHIGVLMFTSVWKWTRHFCMTIVFNSLRYIRLFSHHNPVTLWWLKCNSKSIPCILYDNDKSQAIEMF